MSKINSRFSKILRRTQRAQHKAELLDTTNPDNIQLIMSNNMKKRIMKAKKIDNNTITQAISQEVRKEFCETALNKLGL